MSEVTVSVIGPAVRYWLYEDCYNHFAASTALPFEIVYAGDQPPNKPMPTNFRYIQTPVKPEQCLEIAARHARGKYLLGLFDDIRFSQVGSMERLVALRENALPYSVVSCSCWGDLREVMSRFYYDDVDTPMHVTWGLFMSKEDWHLLGGIDSRFICYGGDKDLCLRAQEAGGNYILSHEVVYPLQEENKSDRLVTRRFPTGFKDVEFIQEAPYMYGVRLFTFPFNNRPIPCTVTKDSLTVGMYDRSFLEKLWAKDGVFIGKRQLPFMGFKERNILTESQPPKGLW